MELLGLALVVVIITFGVLFSLRFFLNDDDSDSRQDVIHSELASSFLSTFFKTTTTCQDLSFTELYQDCARAGHGYGLTCPSEVDTCTYIETKTEDILKKVLSEEYKKRYRFSAKRAAAEIIPTIEEFGTSNQCRSWKSKIYGIPLNPGTIIVQLDICD